MREATLAGRKRGKEREEAKGESYLLVFGNDVGESAGADFSIVATLFHRDSVNLASLDQSRSVRGIHLQSLQVSFALLYTFWRPISTYLEDTVLSTLLLLEDLEGVGIVPRSDDSVRNFSRDDLGGGDITSVGKGDEVPKGGHSVGT